MSTAPLQWVVRAYVLGYGGFVLLGGRVGRRRLFLAALTVFLAFVARFGAVRTMVVGMALGAAGYALFVPVGLGSDYVVSMLPTMVLIGLGFTLVYGPLTIVATDGVEAGEQGLASGLFNTAFQFGAAIGLAVVAGGRRVCGGRRRRPAGDARRLPDRPARAGRGRVCWRWPSRCRACAAGS